MQLELRDIRKNFGRQVVFKKLNYRFESGERYAVLGGNGSGKSTLLQLLYSSLTPNAGTIEWTLDQRVLKVSEVPFHVGYSAPYYELIEELSAREFLHFYSQFRQFQPGINTESLLEIARLSAAADKRIAHFSSGMKQRLKLALAVLSDARLLLLDEPTSNLDPEGKKWYQALLANHLQGRTLVVGTNFDAVEMDICTHQLHIADFV